MGGTDYCLPTFVWDMFPPKSKWSVDRIPDLSGKVALVTGGNTGIGKETCRQLLRKGATVYLAARSRAKAEDAIRELEADTGKVARFVQLDLADLDSVKKAGEEFKSRETQLNILFLNAGVMSPPIEQLTAQGYDMQFGTNVLGHFLLLKLLYPILSASSSPASRSRLVWTSSSVHYLFNAPIKYDTLKDGPERVALGTQQLYCESKFATSLVLQDVARTSLEDGVVCICVDPGNIKTDLQRHGAQGGATKTARDVFFSVILHPVELGVLTQLYAGTAPEADAYNGQYLRPWARLGEPHKGTKDPNAQHEMREYCERAVASWL